MHSYNLKPDLRRYFISFISGLLIAFSSIAQSFISPQFSISSLGQGYGVPMGLAFSRDGSRMFVWEKGGLVRVGNWNNTTKTYDQQTSLVLNISEEVGNWGDYGLLGFALDPNFDVNGYIYLLYVVDRHYLLYYGTPQYSPTANLYNDATIGRITRYRTVVNGSQQLVADPATRQVLLGESITTGIPILHDSHGVGTLMFADDSTLLASAGDGASYDGIDTGSNAGTNYIRAQNDGIIRPEENVGAYRSQMVNSFNGKILRIDRSTGNGIPSNPFYDAANPRSPKSRTWALGFRNPFRFVRRPGSGSSNPAAADLGELYVGDVGWNKWEEFTVVREAGVNAGWPVYEGFGPTEFYPTTIKNRDEPNPLYGTGGCTQQYFTFNNLIKQPTADNNRFLPNPCNSSVNIVSGNSNRYIHLRPALAWIHAGNGGSDARVGIFSGNLADAALIGTPASGVTGIPFYGNCAAGACWYTGTKYGAQYDGTYFLADYVSGWIKNMTFPVADKISKVEDFGSNVGAILCMAQSPKDSLIYMVNYTNNTIIRLNYGGNRAPIAVINSSINYGPAPLAVSFNGSNSYDPDNNPITYSWNFGDGTTSTAANPSHTFGTSGNTTPASFTVTLTVSDNQGSSSSVTKIVSINNTPPIVSITSPLNNTFYTPGLADTTYQLTANVTDDQSLATLKYAWQTILRHNTHEHREAIDTNKITSTTIARVGCTGDVYYYIITLSVTDNFGLAGMDSVKLFPSCATAPPTITVQPVAQSSCAAVQVIFSSMVSDSPLPQVQWQVSNDNGTSWNNVSGATSPQLTVVPVAADNGKLYRAVWTNNAGSSNSNPALLTVNPSPLAPTGASPQTFCFSATVADLNAIGTNIKWFASSSGGTQLPNTTSLINGNHYYASQTVNGCESSLRFDVTAIINSSSVPTITLTGSGSYGPVTSYLWTTVSGPNTPAITNPTSVSTTVTGLIKGSYVFQLSVNGGASTSLVNVNVNPAGSPVVVNAGNDRTVTLPTSSVTLDGSGTTGTINSYSWTLVSGPNTPVIVSSNTVSTSVTGLIQGVYNFRLTVTDVNNVATNDIVQITVNPAPSGGTTPVIFSSSSQPGTSNTVVNTLSGVPAGALLVLTVAQADDINDGANATITSSPVLTWTKRADAGAAKSGNAEIYTAVFAAGGNISITSKWAVNVISAVAYAITNFDPALGGVSGAVNLQSLPSLGITTTRSNSIIFGVSSDWNAINGSTRVYRDAATERLYHFKSGIYTGYHYTKQTTGTNTYTEGLSAPAGMAAGTALLEITGPQVVTATPVADAGFNQTVFFAVAPTGSSSQSFCGSAIISNLIAAGSGIKWYDAPSGGNLLSSTSPVVNGNHYYASQTVNGCESSQRLDVLVAINPNPAPPVINVTQNCNGSSLLSTSATGTILWSTGETTSSITVFTAGTYSVTVTNTNGCSSSSSVTVTRSSTGFTAGIGSQSNVSCYGESTGSITLSVSGGQNPYTYSWSNGATTANITGLAAGSYQVTVTDATGCQTTASTAITQPASALSVGITKVDVLVYGASTGSITATGNGGTSPYTFSLDNLTFQATGTFNSLPAGTYTVFIKDANNCIQSNTATINQPASALAVSAVATDVVCYGDSTGSVQGTATGGTPPYQYKLGNGSYQTGNIFNNLKAGNYTVTVKDAGTSASTTVVVAQPSQAFTFTISKTDISCLSSSGSIAVTATGGTSPYQYSKDGGSTFQAGNVFSGLSQGNYNILVKDNTNCKTPSQIITINGSTSSVTLNGIGSTGAISSYFWTAVSGPNSPGIVSPSSSTTSVTGLIQGTYVFQLSVNGGASTSQVTVNVNPPASPVVVNAGYDKIVTLPTSSVTLDGNGSTGTITSYLWTTVSGPNSPAIATPNSVSTSVTGLVQGIYNFNLSVTDVNNVVTSDNVQITVNPAPSGGTSPVIFSTATKLGTNNTVVNSLTAVPAGALLVLTVAQADDINDGANATVTSSPALTWTKRADAGAAKSGNAEIYTAVFSAGGNINITSKWAVNVISAVAYAITNYDPALDGISAVANLQSAPNVGITTSRSNSIIFGVSSDWNAINGNQRIYRDAATESLYHYKNGIYTGYHYRKQTSAAGLYTEGLSAPTTMSAGTALLEIKGPLGGSVPVIADAGFNQTIGCTNPASASKPLSRTLPADKKLSGLNRENEPGMEVYPNPGNGLFNLLIKNANPGKAVLKVLDSRGRLLMMKEVTLWGRKQIIPVDLVNKANGIYIIQISYPEGVLSGRAMKE